MRRATALLIAIVVALVASASLPAGSLPSARADRPGERRERRAASVSVGLPFQGRLRHAVLLRESEHVRYAGEYRAGGHFWGTTELVALLERAAARVAQRIPGARLSVGELSAQAGGRLSGHRSHQNGRDVDVAFYMLDGDGDPYDPYGFAAFDRRGLGLAPNQALHFDDARNWELVARLLTDPDARVQYVFVADTLRNRLLATARRRHASRAVIARAEQALVQPSHGHPHRNHFHVRIYCPPADRPQCRDREPFHAWYPGTPPRDADDGETVASAD